MVWSNIIWCLFLIHLAVEVGPGMMGDAPTRLCKRCLVCAFVLWACWTLHAYVCGRLAMWAKAVIIGAFCGSHRHKVRTRVVVAVYHVPEDHLYLVSTEGFYLPSDDSMYQKLIHPCFLFGPIP